MVPVIGDGDRLVAFGGAHNFRDLGGYPTVDGGRTRWRTVYRSDGLQSLTDDDIVRYNALGITTMFDLRRDVERIERPNRVPSVPWCMMTPADEAGAIADAPTFVDERVSGERRLLDVYQSMLRHAAPLLGKLIEQIVAPGGTPVGFHCHAGKDRTGFVAAVLLEAVGVPRDVVLDDYELTARYRRREQQQESFERLVAGGMPVEAALGIMGSPRWAMAETLDELDSDFGGIQSYLSEQAELDIRTLEALRDRLVEH